MLCEALPRLEADEYPGGLWYYEPHTYQPYRYVLGRVGRRPLVCIGINPSTAQPGALDPTLKSVERLANANGFDSWIMFNVYPQRATNPNDMDKTPDRALCDEKDLVLIVDEVQTGVGRTGTFLCCEHYNLQPDVVTLAKGLGGGLPIGAVLMNEKVAAGMGPSSHGSTFGGNPVVCAGANVVVDRMDASFLANVNERAVQLRTGLEKLPRVKSLSGIGLMVGIEFLEGIKAADVLAACREKGLLVLTAKTRLRLLPPLTLTAHDVERALEILGSVLAEMDPSKTEEQA